MKIKTKDGTEIDLDDLRMRAGCDAGFYEDMAAPPAWEKKEALSVIDALVAALSVPVDEWNSWRNPGQNVGTPYRDEELRWEGKIAMRQATRQAAGVVEE